VKKGESSVGKKSEKRGKYYKKRKKEKSIVAIHSNM
jgi:hypothetical protein